MDALALRDCNRITACGTDGSRLEKIEGDDMKPINAAKRPIADLEAANSFRDSLVARSDGRSGSGAPLWHGWAIFEAFLAGLDHARDENAALARRNRANHFTTIER